MIRRWLNKLLKKKEPSMPADPFSSGDYDGPEFVVEQYFDEERGVNIWVELVCTCGLPFARKGVDSFYCLHCDEGCDEDPRNCRYCQYAMMDRAEEE